MEQEKKLHLRIWRQKQGESQGKFEEHDVTYVDEMSFLEVLDVLNESIVKEGKDPIAFDYDCREGICGSCGVVVDGIAHGPKPGMTICQHHMRHFDGKKELTVEPWRVGAFPIVKDLVVDREAYDKLIQAGGYVSVDTGGTPDANAIPIAKEVADLAMDYAACIGCGACAAACKNAAPHLFLSAKIAQLAALPQGKVERKDRVLNMVEEMERLGFGMCSNEGECEAVCPKEIKTTAIATMRREFISAFIKGL